MKLQLVAGLAVFAVSALAHARGPCSNDIESLCKDVKPGDGRIEACIESHEAEVRNECKNEIKTRKERRTKWDAGCKADVAKFCKDVKPGNGRVEACIQDHIQELGGECRDAAVHAARVSRAVDACGKSVKKECPAAATNLEKMTCASDHIDTVHPACAIELDSVR